MTDQPIKPERITKPIQLLGAWLAGLFAIDSCFLFAAANMPVGSWEARALILAAIINVPLFLIAVFLLQTRFRPELQEDSYYSTYLSRKTNEVIALSKDDVHFAEIRQRLEELDRRVAERPELASSPLANLKIGINEHFKDRKEIGAALLDRGVVAYSTFAGDKPPPDRTVAISQYLSQETLGEVIKLARDLKFDGYTLFDNRGEATEEEVLLGAYGGTRFEFAKEKPPLENNG